MIVSVRFVVFFFLMIRRPPRSTRTDTLFPYTTLFRSSGASAARRCLLLRWFCGCRDKDASGLERTKRAILGFAADEIEHQIKVVSDVLKPFRPVDDHLVRPVRANKVNVLRRAGGHEAGATTLGDMDGEMADRSEESRVGQECVMTCVYL